MVEARNATGSITAQYYPYGQTISGSSYFYSLGTPGSVYEMTNSAGAVQAEYSFDPFGQVSKLQGSLSSDFGFAGYYVHAPSGLNVAVYRMYSSKSGRWLNRDPIAESGGVNLYAYLENDPVNMTDPLGYLKFSFPGTNFCGPGCSSGKCGPNFWENSPFMPIGPGDRNFAGPKNALDWCCYIHDLCMHYGHTLPTPLRCSWNKGCHQDLSNCAKHAGGLMGHGFGWAFGIVFGILGVTGSGPGDGPINDPRMPPPSGAPEPGPDPPLHGPL